MMELQSFKCKNCGGIMQAVANEEGVLKCEYCESVFTIPKMDSDAEVLQYLNIGEHGLDTCHFDDAFTAFQKAAQLNKKEPEAYWGMALATAGVQYLDDCQRKHLQPIVHNITGKDFSKDKNYLKAISLATSEQKNEYIQKAIEICDIHKKFYDLKQSGLYYDCFICVKVTEDGSDRHTEDSVIANKIYDLLKEEGYNPFYSEEEIQGRTGSDYEAMILYALHSSPCMFVVCTNEEYLQTAWVKNEYTRFLKMLRDEEKERESITFVFQNNVIEKLPGVSGKIQGINFKTFNASEKIKDFVEKFAVKNIPEIVRKEYTDGGYTKKQTMKQSVVKRQLTAATIGEITVSDQSKLKMVNQFLERDNFASATSLCKNMIKENPSNSEAYWLLFLAENNCSNEKEFKSLKEEVTDYDNLEKAIASVSEYNRKRVFYSALYYYAKKTLYLSAYKEFIELPDSTNKNVEELSKLFYQKALDDKNEEIFDQVIKTITNTDQYIDMNFEFANILPTDSAQKYYDNILKADEGHHKALWHSFVNGIPNLFNYFSDEANFKLIEDKIYSYGFNEYATGKLIDMVKNNLEENTDNACKVFDFIISMIPKENNDLYLEYLNEIVDKLIRLGKFGKVTKYNEMLLVVDQYDHNAHFNRCLINHKLSNPIGLIKYADKFMDDKNFYAAMSSYSEKYPDNDNIYMEIASQLEKLFCLNDYPDIFSNIVNRVYVSRDELIDCYETIINVVKAVGDKLYNGILKENNCKTDKDFYKLTTDVTTNKHWQMIKDIAVICDDKKRIQIVDDLMESQSNISKKNRIELKTLKTLRTLAFTNIIVIFAIIAFFLSLTFRPSFPKLADFYYLIFGTTKLYSLLIVFFVFSIVGMAICLLKLLIITRTPNKPEITKLRMGKNFSIISNVIAGVALIVLFSILIVPSIKMSKANTGKNGLFTNAGIMYDLKAVDGGYSIEKVLGDYTDLTIPKKLDFKNIVRLGNNVFKDNRRLKSVHLPETIKSIGNFAFYNCSGIESIYLPDSVQNIGNSAFSCCTSLEKIQMGENVIAIGENAFANCNIKEAIIPVSALEALNKEKLVSLELYGSSVSSISFSDCRNLQKVVFHEGLKTIPSQAFGNCYYLKEVVIPNSATTVSTNTFSNCRLEKVTAPSYWLEHMPKNYLVEVEITNGSSVKNDMFYYCGTLKKVVLPEGMTTIENGAFSHCYSMTSITLPSTLTNIGDNAFNNCSALQELDIPQNVKTIGDSAFACSGIENIIIPDNVTSLGNNAFDKCYGLKNVVLGKGIKTIGKETFYYCGALENISMSDNITEIGDGAFCFCTNLQNIILPENLTKLGVDAFNRCESLQSVVIPNQVNSIGARAFNLCSKLKIVKFGTNLKTIGDSAFEDCYELTELNFEYVETIERESFSDCSGLSKVTISSNVKNIGRYAFTGCRGAIFYCEPTSKPSGWDSSWLYENYATIWDYKNNTTPGYINFNGVKYTLNHVDKTAVIEKQSIYLNGDIEIPENIVCNNVVFSVKTIKASAFDACNITSIKISDGIDIEARAFFNCSKLRSMNLPATLTQLPYWMLYSCNNLSKIYYNGTSSQWINLPKNSGWCELTNYFTIECCDGKILSKYGAVVN